VAVVAIVPVAHEASEGRLIVQAPAGTDRLGVTVAGVPVRVRLLARQDRNGRVLITVQISAVAPTGADLGLFARNRSRALGRGVVRDVHLLGAGAFRSPRPPPSIASARAGAEARRIAAATTGRIGISAQCLGTRRTADANGERAAVAASTLKAAILAAALARDRRSPTRPAVYGTYRAAIVDSSNSAANRALAIVGAGSHTVGARRVNALMSRLRMRSSFLDGPYRLSGGPSLKRTSAADLARLARALYVAAIGEGRLASLGVSRHEARVLIGLMASETYPGLIREHVPGPVAHKAGWLDSVENDLVLVFGAPGGPCAVGITTENLSFRAASAVGRAVTDRVLPLLALRRPPNGSSPAPADGATTTSVASDRPPRLETRAATEANGRDGPPWGRLLAGVGMLVLTAGVVASGAKVRRRQR
jgi:hypothetical protein